MGSTRFWTILLVLSIGAEAAFAQPCSATDNAALLYFSREIWNSGTAFASWIEGTNCCNWEGIICNGAGRVTSLIISQADIPTRVPLGEPYIICAGLGDLNSLEILNITNIGLGGTISTTLGGLSNLRTFVIDGCNLIGPIPQTFCNLNNLQIFDMSNNLLDSYPPCFDSKPSILTIDLTGNRFAGGPKRP